MPASPVRIAVTGAAGQICYSLLFRIANGDVCGRDQPVHLNLLDLPQTADKMQAVVMELEDCAFPSLANVNIFHDPAKAFRDADVVFLVGARPRSGDMKRRDLLAANAEIFQTQGRALNENADRNVKALVVGNPANANAYITKLFAPDLPAGAITSMMRLDHNRAVSLLANKAGVGAGDIEGVIVWGNHSETMFPDWRFAMVDGRSLKDLIADEAWYRDAYIPQVAGRGAAVIKARGASSAVSAANAATDHMHDWVIGTGNRWVSMGITSDGSYGIPEGLICSVPAMCQSGTIKCVQGLPFDDFAQSKLNASIAELVAERNEVHDLLRSEIPAASRTRSPSP